MLKLDEHFKGHEIYVLESSRSLLVYTEYAQKVRENVVQGSARASFNLQWQIAQAATAMTQEEIRGVQVLERTKEILLGKL